MFCNTNILETLKNLLKRFKMAQTLNLKHFKLSEFDSPDEVGSGKKMDKEFLEKLDYARHNAGIPFKINSGYRTEVRNTLVGGRFGSSHKKGLAADIGYTGSRQRYLILSALMDVGINRFGIAKTYIHCDVDKEKDQDVIWLYN
jgi:zinc D-Ala-D-Ala carboxypeptidase|tara:strand:- start:117 stop:548 length:432 start_codon:yes stop_codon:yes gene_type:complete